ncbi:hypothetical protein OGAPHI_006950 [Ogataea philodendri]|uniref:Uncharacterized protein n=1 Tax=Ogataea philodendri TaxID=1378263 RepID=A0A9P8SZR6_9ASCO|nr:uncharacterized protein OGAPHI_006950 [Ogataea philodendri]KAH3660364.1 hypothetical protein OGAPHI_006950 [Ogataea philodendri]
MSRSHVSSVDSDNLRRLEHALVKFHSYKRNTTSKTNILRLSLLPFLRSTTTPWTARPLSNVDRSLKEHFLELSAVLLRWWKALLVAVKDLHQMTAIDRNCYLEGISRIVGRQEWLEIAKSTQSELKSKHDAQLLETFEFCIARLDLKNISLPINAFVGKIFAYAFIKLPDISRGLLFLLNSRVRNYKEFHDLVVSNKSPHHPISEVNKSDFDTVIGSTLTFFPAHLHPLINSAKTPRKTRYKLETKFLNSISPPSEKINGISDPRGLWCSRWASLDNIDLFCSFMRHYLTLVSFSMQQTRPLTAQEVYALPGFPCLITHVFEIIDFHVFQSTKHPNVPSLESQVSKILKLLRDFLMNPRHEYEAALSMGFLQCMDNALKLIFYKTTIFQMERVDLCFDIWMNLIKSIKVTTPFLLQAIDWKFWINTVLKMLHSQFINCELKALSIFYQIWDYIPTNQALEADWVSNKNESLKYNLTVYLTNPENWTKFFGHYLPLVRCYYIKLLVWKVLGLDCLNLNMDGTFVDVLTAKRIQAIVKSRLDQSFELSKLQEVVPTDPILNKKFIISFIGSKDDPKKDIIRSHPYEILDDAVYTCANLSTANNSATSLSSSTSSLSSTTSASNSKSRLAPTWVSKLFKKKADEEPSVPEPQQGLPAPSLSSQSLTLSSKSSSPSLLSSGTSFSSPQSSMSSVEFIDSNPDSNYKPNMPIELSLRVPDLSKPLFKFQLVLNEKKIHDTLKQLKDYNSTKFVVGDNKRYNTKPKLPDLGVDTNSSSLSDESDIDTDSRSLDFQFRSTLVLDEKPFDFGSISATPTYANAIYEYNQIVTEFERFIKERLDNLSGASTPMETTLFTLEDDLPASIPLLLSESPEKLNAY